MTTQLATIPATSFVDGFKLARTSKAGKVSERNLLGLIMDGTPDERMQAGLALAKEGWDNGKLLIVLDEIKRVFNGRMFDMAVAFCKVDIKEPTKPELVNLFDNLVRINEGAKGIKAKYIKLMSELSEFSKGEADRKEARRLAWEASQTTTISQ